MVLRIIFIHLDLGIGGAEQLILQLAQASLAITTTDDNSSNNKHTSSNIVDLEIITTRCDAHHCFAAVKPVTGNLYPYLHVYGRWIPASLIGNKGRAMMSTIRVLYLAYCVVIKQQALNNEYDNDNDTLIVLDVLPTPMPFLHWTIPHAALLFYCHFPDQLLTRNNNNSSSSSSSSTSTRQRKSWYRTIFDSLENITMQYADTIVVNSQFTKRTVQETFSFLQNPQQDDDNDDLLPVLYPALDTSSLDQNTASSNSDNDDMDHDPKNLVTLLKRKPIVSLNRYERKKNVLLLLQAIQWIQEQQQKQQEIQELPPIIIAGGYDVHNVENVEYYTELKAYCHEHNLQDHVTFLQSISDEIRCQLLRNALVVVYTPQNEHFGIVPLEAMYSTTPVICVNSGGPIETVVHETTGFLCLPTPESFGQAILTLLQNPTLATTMGEAAHLHIVSKFGQERLHQEWKRLVYNTIQKRRRTSTIRRLMTPRQYQIVIRCILYVMPVIVLLGTCLCLIYILRQLHVFTMLLKPSTADNNETIQEL